MKVVVIFKWCRNPQDALVGASGNVDWPGVKLSANDDDPAVMDIAKAIAGDDEIIALTIGDGDIAWAAARGAARTVVVTDALTDVNSAATGAVLAAAVKRMEDVDVVLISDSAWDYGVVSAFVGQMGWQSMAAVTAAELDQGSLHVTRKTGAVCHVLKVQTPVVLAVMATQSEESEPSMKQVLMARKKPVEKITIADLGCSPEIAAVASIRTRFPDTPPAVLYDGADPASACEQLMAALHNDGVV